MIAQPISVEMTLLWTLLVLAVLMPIVLLFVIAKSAQVLAEQTRILQGLATQLAVMDARQQNPNE